MAKRTNLKQSPNETLAEIVTSLHGKTSEKTTHAAGIKDLGDLGDVVWEDTDPDTGGPRARSVRRFAVELDSTVERAAALEKRLADSEAELDEARAGLENLREKELPALKEQLANVGDVDFSEFDAKIAAAEAQIAATEQAWRDAIAGEAQAREAGDAAAREALDDGLADQFATLDSAIDAARGEASQALASARSELDSADAALSKRIDGVFRNMTVADTAYMSNAVIGNLAARIAKVIELEASRITAGQIGAAQINVVELAGEVARFITLDASQLRVTDAAEINDAVVQALAARTADIQEAFIQNLRTNGAAIDEAVIGDLAANIITSGLFRTAKEGQRWEIDSNGIVMYTPMADGLDVEVVRLGPSGDNLVTVGKSTVSPSAISATRGSFETLDLAGEDINTLVDRGPRGVIAQAKLDRATQWDGSNSEIGRLEVYAELQRGRLYSITVSQHFVETRSPAWARYMEVLRYNSNGWQPSKSSTALATSRYLIGGTSSPTTVGPLVGWVDTGENQDKKLYSFRLFSKSESTDRDVHIVATYPQYPMWLTVRDEGPSQAVTGGATITEGQPKQGDATNVQQPTDSSSTRVTNVWKPGLKETDGLSGGLFAQGWHPTEKRFMSSGWSFPQDMQIELNRAKSIERFEVYLFADLCSHPPGVASLCPNNGNYGQVFGSIRHESPDWPSSSGRWVQIPSTWHQNILNGTYKGITVKTDRKDYHYLVWFDPDDTRFRVTYTV